MPTSYQHRSGFFTRSFFLLGVLVVACTPQTPPPVAASKGPTRAPVPFEGLTDKAALAEVAAQARGTVFPSRAEPGTAVPVFHDDPMWGNQLAPVTMVIWGDFECPFTAKLVANLPALMEQFGPDSLRIVWRHNPLPFHKNAMPAHLAAETVMRLGGNRAFWHFHALAFHNQRSLDPEHFESWAVESGVSRSSFRAAFEAAIFAEHIERDMASGKTIGVRGTPATWVNGVAISGAQPLEKFQAAINTGLEEATALLEEGTPETRIYASLSEKNYIAPAPPPPPPPPDLTVWQVPLDGSPIRGNPAALVTIVMFGDFQCPFCAKAMPTLKALEQAYGDKLRLVFKHNPLAMHTRAEQAAELAIEAFVQKGSASFWNAAELLYGDQIHLEDADLLGLARTLQLDIARAKKNIESKKYLPTMVRDQELADDLNATGTPTFFINGRRVVGAQPKELFESVINEELTKAEKLVVSGTAPTQVYDAIMKDAKQREPQERVVLPAPTKENPGKGAKAGAPVVVQVFADFQCPYCKKLAPNLDELIQAYPGKVRVVFRHNPLPMHPDALLAAEASMEVKKQKGEAAFWSFASMLFEDQSEQELSREAIVRKAVKLGVDEGKMKAALDAHTHRAAIQADADLAARFGLSGTPTLVIQDYLVTGAQPLGKLKRFVKRALGPHEPIAKGAERTAKADAHANLDPSPRQNNPIPAGHFGAKHLLVMYAGSMRAPASITRTKAEARARAEEARKKLLAGASFASLVAAYSDEPGAASRNGDLGTFPKGAMVPSFQQAVENLVVGETSEVVETPFGFHLIVRTH